jgi:hypothetical protein
VGTVVPALVLKGGSNPAVAEEFVRFLVAEGWLAHYLGFSAERFLPAMPKLLEQPFWLDSSDPHRMASVMQVDSRGLGHNYAATSGNWRHQLVNQEHIWGKAIHCGGVRNRQGDCDICRPRRGGPNLCKAAAGDSSGCFPWPAAIGMEGT